HTRFSRDWSSDVCSSDLGLIFAVPMPLMNGGVVNVSPYYHTVDKNIGNLYNRGVEVSLRGVVVQKENFSYSTTLNLTHLKNRITEMPPGQPLIQDRKSTRLN